MTAGRSAAEREIRDAVVAWCRSEMPDRRIVHELNTCGTGSPRADLAAVGREELVLFEIKSERDTLDRLKTQIPAFLEISHHTVLVAHRRWFDVRVLRDGSTCQVPSERLEEARRRLPIGCLWAYPKPSGAGEWAMLDRHQRPPQPRAETFLRLLWRDELMAECALHRVGVHRRATMQHMIREMAWAMSGKEVARAVCRRLRRRAFAEADPPVLDGEAP